MTMADPTSDDPPPEIRSRIMAATAHASVRTIDHCAEAPGLPRGTWEVHALAGDRIVQMVLGLRDDGSVAEETRTFLTADVLGVSFEPDGATLSVRGPSGAETVPVPDAVARALPPPAAEGFESAVKGVGQSIAGRLKEMAGQFLDDPDLEAAGTTQRIEGEQRRAQNEAPTEP